MHFKRDFDLDENSYILVNSEVFQGEEECM